MYAIHTKHIVLIRWVLTQAARGMGKHMPYKYMTWMCMYHTSKWKPLILMCVIYSRCYTEMGYLCGSYFTQKEEAHKLVRLHTSGGACRGTVTGCGKLQMQV